MRSYVVESRGGVNFEYFGRLVWLDVLGVDESRSLLKDFRPFRYPQVFRYVRRVVVDLVELALVDLRVVAADVGRHDVVVVLWGDTVKIRVLSALATTLPLFFDCSSTGILRTRSRTYVFFHLYVFVRMSFRFFDHFLTTFL